MTKCLNCDLDKPRPDLPMCWHTCPTSQFYRDACTWLLCALVVWLVPEWSWLCEKQQGRVVLWHWSGASYTVGRITLRKWELTLDCVAEDNVYPRRVCWHVCSAFGDMCCSPQQAAEGVSELRGHWVGEEQSRPPASLPKKPAQPQEWVNSIHTHLFHNQVDT